MSAPVDKILLPDGTRIFTDGATQDSYIEVTDPLTLPEFGDAREFIGVASLSDIGEKYKSTQAESADYELEFNYLEEDAGQIKVQQACLNGDALNFYVKIPGTAKDLKMNITMGSWKHAALQKKTQMKIMFSGKVNGLISRITPITLTP